MEKDSATDHWVGRRVFLAEEHGEVAIPHSLIFGNGKLNIYPEIAAKGILSVISKKDQLVVRATAWVGLVPVNDQVAIDVRPRVPIRTIEEVIRAIGDAKSHVFLNHSRRFTLGATPTPSFLDLLATRLSVLVQEIRMRGLHFAYSRSVNEGAVIGSFDPWRSRQLQVRRGNLQVAVSSYWRRSVDTQANRFIREAVRSLLTTYRSLSNKKDKKKIMAGLAQADFALSRASLNELDRSLPAPRDVDGRPDYAEALLISEAVLANGGLIFRGEQDGALLNPILLDMEDAFERYLRLRLSQEGEKRNGLRFKDGNLGPPDGGRRALYSPPNLAAASAVHASPDIVVVNKEQVVAIVDVKYKNPKRIPDRDDLNQLITYAEVYGVKKCVLAFPRRQAHEAVVELVGNVGSVEIAAARFDLDSEDLDAEAERFYVALESHLATRQAGVG